MDIETILARRASMMQAMRVDTEGRILRSVGRNVLGQTEVAGVLSTWGEVVGDLALGSIRELAVSDEEQAMFVFGESATSSVAVVDAPSLDQLGARANEIRETVWGKR